MTEKQTLKATLVLELQDLAEAKEAYDFIINEDTNNEADPDIANTDARPDGVYLIYGDGSRGRHPSSLQISNRLPKMIFRDFFSPFS